MTFSERASPNWQSDPIVQMWNCYREIKCWRQLDGCRNNFKHFVLNGSDIMCLAFHAVIIVKMVPIYMKVVRKSWVIVLVTRKTFGVILNYQHITTVRSSIPTSGQRYPTHPVQSDLVDRPTLLIHIGISICQNTSTKDIAWQSAKSDPTFSTYHGVAFISDGILSCAWRSHNMG